MILSLLLLAVLLLPLASGALSFAVDTRRRLIRLAVFPLLGLSGAIAVGLGGYVLLTDVSQILVYSPGLPWLHWQFKLDPLAGFFLTLIGLVTVAVSLFGPDYMREYRHGKQPVAVLGFFSGLFVTGMLMVVVSADDFSFMVALERMSLSSSFLVVFQH